MINWEADSIDILRTSTGSFRILKKMLYDQALLAMAYIEAFRPLGRYFMQIL